jgi:hypothetical protein
MEFIEAGDQDSGDRFLTGLQDHGGAIDGRTLKLFRQFYRIYSEISQAPPDPLSKSIQQRRPPAPTPEICPRCHTRRLKYNQVILYTIAMSTQLQQILEQARQLSPQEQLELASQLFSEISPPHQEQAQEQPEAELEYVGNVLVVKSQGKKLSGDLLAEMREDRMWQVGGR